MANEYDITKAFARIEEELMQSMIRNMERHKAEESDEGIEWSMWQVEQLKALEKYKKENRKKYEKEFESINLQINELIRSSKEAGGMEQELTILRAIKNGFKAKRVPKDAMTAEFFKLNERKLEALIKATTKDMQKAETAILRMADDQYRQVIFNAQVYANTGAGTYEKAVDMATQDMLKKGLNCVEYANGARHTLKDYVDMAIRTASKRAYLQGEGEKRKEWGISTVIVNKRGNPCPKCLPFCGKVLIDDVWSGGSKKDGPYPLMSKAIAAGLYHPRCKDSHTTYFPGISSPPDGTYTKDEIKQIEEESKQETKQQYAASQAEKFGRLAKYSLDAENMATSLRKAEVWRECVDYMSNSFRPEYGEYNNITLDLIDIPVKRVKNSMFDMVTDTWNGRRNKAVRLAEKSFRDIQKTLSENFEMPTISLVDFEKHGINVNAIGGYHRKSGILFINSKYDTPKKILGFINENKGQFANTTVLSPYLHELGHKKYYDTIDILAKHREISYTEAKKVLDCTIMNCIENDSVMLADISDYARKNYLRGNYSEVIAECFASDAKEAKMLLSIFENER